MNQTVERRARDKERKERRCCNLTPIFFSAEGEEGKERTPKEGRRREGKESHKLETDVFSVQGRERDKDAKERNPNKRRGKGVKRKERNGRM